MLLHNILCVISKLPLPTFKENFINSRVVILVKLCHYQLNCARF